MSIREPVNMKVFICLLNCWVLGYVTAKSQSIGIVELFEDSNDRFTAKMLDIVSKVHQGKNVVMSSFSVLQPLAQLSLGAVGHAHSELLTAIGMPDDAMTKIVFPLVNGRVEQVVGVTLKTASMLYVPIGQQLVSDFEADSKYLFHSEVQTINFKDNVKAAKTINTWVERKTNYQIKHLISPSLLAGDTSLVIINALYFKGKWKNTFLKNNTVYRDFYANKTFFSKVRTMHKTDKLKYSENKLLSAQLLELPYEDEETSFLVILPNQVDGLPQLIAKLGDSTALKHATAEMYLTDVDVYLPKLKIETRINLKDTLGKLGVKQMFKSLNSGLDKIVQSSKVFVSDAIQQAFIEVNEEGTEAAAANAFLESKSAVLKKLFRANHPFVFFLKYGPTTLFSGVFLGYGGNYMTRDGETNDEGKRLRISFDVPFDVLYLPT